jgi:hypothetical protein
VDRKRRSPPIPTAVARRPEFKVKKENQPKKLIEVDNNGKPVGKMFVVFQVDIVVFSKELDPSKSYEG